MKKIKLPKMNVRAELAPKTFNDKNNTVEVVFTTDAPVRRYDPWNDERFDEVLGMKEGEVRMERLLSSAPVLNNHSRGDLSDQIGVVETASLDGTKGHATLRLSKRESVKEIVQDIKDGIIKNISVGYKIHKMQKTGEIDGIPTMRAIDWEPLEISFVTIPADGTAQVKSERNEKEQELFECEIRGFDMNEKENEVETKSEEVVIETKSEEVVENEVKNEEVETKSEEVVSEEVVEEVIETKSEDEVRTEASKAERSRIADINNICKKFDIEPKEIDTFIEKEYSLEKVREIVIEKLAKSDEQKGTNSMNETKIEVGQTDIEKKCEGIENAMLAKSQIVDVKTGSNPFALSDNGRNFNNMSLLRMAEVVLKSKGVNTDNMSKVQIAERAMHSTSDFKTILANVLGKSLRQGYEAAPQTFSSFTRQTEKDDLKEISRTQFGEGGALNKVKEGEEYKHDTISEAGEKYKIEKFGKIINITEETLINDDLDAFTRIPALFGQRAKDSESDEVWGIMLANAAMSDGNNLYSAAHSNHITAAGGALSETSLSDARSLYRKQVGLDGMKLNLIPKYLAVPVELETTAEKLISSLISPNQASQINAFSSTGRTPLELIVEPRLSDASSIAWFLFGMLGQIDMIEMAKLRGQSAPTITQQEGFDIDGLRIKIKHRFGVKAIDHRGMLKSDGVA